MPQPNLFPPDVLAPPQPEPPYRCWLRPHGSRVWQEVGRAWSQSDGWDLALAAGGHGDRLVTAGYDPNRRRPE